MAKNFNDLTQEWKARSFPFKCLMVFLTITSSTSLASLSNTIITWRGFIRDAVLIWHEWSHTINRIISSFANVNFTQVQIDVFILQCVLSGAMIRSKVAQLYIYEGILLTQYMFRNGVKKASARYAFPRVVALTHLSLGISNFFIPAALVNIKFGQLIFFYTCISAIAPGYYALRHKFYKNNVDLSIVKLLYINLSIVLLIFMLLVAINQGLAADLPTPSVP